VHRVVCAVECGTSVNPDTIAAQMEGGTVFGLTAVPPIAPAVGNAVYAAAGRRLRSLPFPGIAPQRVQPGSVLEEVLP
jgi:CO/xanthine dehydrogenase Mo-binding subunit